MARATRAFISSFHQPRKSYNFGASSCRIPRRARYFCTAASPPSPTVTVPASTRGTREMNVREILTDRVYDIVKEMFGDEKPPSRDACLVTKSKFGDADYQSMVGKRFSKKLQRDMGEIAQEVIDKLDVGGMCKTPFITGGGFINFALTDAFVFEQMDSMFADRDRLGIPEKAKEDQIKTIVDFSSPNIAKDMHVGHLRSTIIGDTLARTFEFLGHPTMRLNHVGDWGTQFGQLIAFMKIECPDFLTNEGEAKAKIGDLVEFYKKAKAKFDEDDDFKTTAKNEVVKLQSGNEESMNAWKFITELSRIEFQKVYDRLDIQLETRGESFYNPFLGEIVQELKEKKLAEINEGATIMKVSCSKTPVIVQKTDGGFLYATTDLAAIRYRVNEDKAQRIVYVTDAGQEHHFKTIFEAAEMAGYWDKSKVQLKHVQFGLVQGADGKKFKTRAGTAPKLAELLDEARDRVRKELLRREEEQAAKAIEEGRDPPATKSEETLQYMAETMGMAAVKYADLKNNRTQNYKFSFDKMVKLVGDTAPYMMYAYARVQGIYIEASNKIEVPEKVDFVFAEGVNEERALAKELLRLPEILFDLEEKLTPNGLCEYAKGLTVLFSQFYEQCPVIRADTEELKVSRLALCQVYADTLKLCLTLLGIKTLDRI